jgi:hypothetical protein
VGEWERIEHLEFLDAVAMAKVEADVAREVT